MGMIHNFKDFSTDAILNIGSSSILKQFERAKQTDLYTFIWAKSNTIELIIDSVPFKLKPNHIVALTPIQYLEYMHCVKMTELTKQTMREF